jgi:predicted Rdx family selenoprotein
MVCVSILSHFSYTSDCCEFLFSLSFVGLKRGHRATWVATELFSTFEPPTIASISLVPRSTPETAGRWRVWLVLENDGAGGDNGSNDVKQQLVWDRKTEGGFGELVR